MFKFSSKITYYAYGTYFTYRNNSIQKEVPFRTMRTMSNSIMNEMFPGEKIHKVDLHEGMLIRSMDISCSFVISIATLHISLMVLLTLI